MGMKLSAYLSQHKIDERIFGESLGVSEFAVRKWRYGQRTPSVEVIHRISEITDGAVSFHDWLPEEARAS